MEEHALELLQVTGYIMIGLLVILKGIIIWAFKHGVDRLNAIQKSIQSQNSKIHCLEIRVAKIETRLGIPDNPPNNNT